MSSQRAQSFGGEWTREKLRILKAYLDAYTTALKNTQFNLWYVDAFAGSGAIDALDYDDERALLTGSTQIALEVTDRPFDHLLFIEKDPVNAQSLKDRVRELGEDSRTRVDQGDANLSLPAFCESMDPLDRAVVFLDPFATQVDWTTVEAVAATEKCDVWILFPVSAIRRLLPRQGPTRHEPVLDRVFGDESWKELQRPAAQQSFDLFGDGPDIETEAGVEAIGRAYMAKLEVAFAGVAPAARILRNSRNSPLYLFMFAAGNKAGAPIAVRIANHLLTAF